MITVSQEAAGEGVQVQLGGQAIEQTNKPGVGGTAFGFIAAAVVLFLVFGSLFAMLMPLLTAGFALGTGVAVIGLLSHAITMASFSSELSLLIGLGVGVDYALFIVTRFRQGLLRGLSAGGCDRRRARHLRAGGPVRRDHRLHRPARHVHARRQLPLRRRDRRLRGRRDDRGRGADPAPGAARLRRSPHPQPQNAAGARRAGLPLRERRVAGVETLGGVLQRRPALFAAGAAILLLVIAIPFLSIRLGSSDEGNDPSSTTTRQAYDLLAEGFGPGFNGPLQLVAAVPEQGGRRRLRPRPRGGEEDRRRGRSHARQSHPGSRRGRRRGDRERDPGRVAAGRLDHRPPPPPARRNHPRRDRQRRPDVLVGGQTAIFEDFSGVLSQKLPLFIGVVVLLSFLLLMAVFRSLVVPLMASVMNLLSAGAAFGVITAIFQWGWGASLIGIDRTGPIEAFLPVMVFAILFGLSMDYEVFLVSRIYEEWRKRGDNREAVVHGLAATARTITAAAAIMVLVFGAFVLGGERVIMLFGVGLASAVLLDALVVRSVLVPSLMLLAGKSNWWLPAWLDRVLPHLNVEGSSDSSASPSARAAPGDTPVTGS